MLKKIILTISILILSFPTTLSANDNISNLAQNWFKDFSNKISKKYTDEKEIIYFKGFSTKLNKLLAEKEFTPSQIDLIEDLIALSNEKIFKTQKNSIENPIKIILKTNPLVNDFKYFSYNKENIFLENGIWYTYKFDSHLTFPKGVTIKKQDLTYNKIDKNNTLVFLREDKALGFANDYEKIKLISDEIIYGISDKYSLLSEIKDDKKKLSSGTDLDYKYLKNKSKELTKNLSEEEKIKNIYSYILEEIEYPESFSLTDYKIFSGIETFNNKSGVCEGYTKLFKYMLNFAGISDIEVIRGYVIDAQDFPQVGHAWVRIGENYYDPTFDDPIGQTSTKKYNQYMYYKLPYDLFYTNRFTFEKIPSYLKEESLENRKTFIAKKIAPIVYKYRYSGFNILKPYTLKLDYGIDLEKDIRLDDLKLIIEYYDVNNFSFIKNGKTKNIKTLKYFKVDDSKVDTILEQLDYNFDGYYLFKWKLENGNHEYRLAYDVEFN